MWRAFCAALPPEADVQTARELNRQYDAGLISLEEFIKQVEKATGERPQILEAMLDNERTKNTPLLDYIRTLRPGYKIGLLSNVGTNWIRDSFLTKAEQELFDAMVFSFEVGMTKPDEKIFRLACEKLGASIEESVMIDDVDSYIQSAKSFGMQGIVYQDFPQFKAELEQILSHA